MLVLEQVCSELSLIRQGYKDEFCKDTTKDLKRRTLHRNDKRVNC